MVSDPLLCLLLHINAAKTPEMWRRKSSKVTPMKSREIWIKELLISGFLLPPAHPRMLEYMKCRRTIAGP